MAKTTKTSPAESTFVKYDSKGNPVDTQKTASPALRNELLTSGYREEKPKATSTGGGGTNTGSGSASGSSGAGK